MTLTLKIVNQVFHMTHHHVKIHHHTKFGKKWLGSSGDTEWTQSDTWTELQMNRQSDSNIPSPHVFMTGGGGYKKKGPLAPFSPMKRAVIQSYGIINFCKQNTCVCACIKRSCRHVKDPVVRAIVWWIKKTHRYCMHISVNIYCTFVQ